MIARVSPPLPLLITGISGVPGFNALPYFQRRWPGQVIGMRQRDNDRQFGPGIVCCDAEDCDAIRRLVDQYDFAAILDCAGACALKACELNPALAWRVNVDGMQNLLDAIEGRPTRLVHLSVDMVFAGKPEGGYVETDPTDPVTVYGKVMVAAEQILAERRPDAAVLRISLPMGISFNGHAGAIDWIQSRFRKSRPATLFYDEIRTPTYTDCMNRVYRHVLARSDMQGLYHAGGPSRLTLFQIAQVINRVGGYDPELLMGALRANAPPIPPRAGNVALDSSKLAAALGFQPFDPWPNVDRYQPTHERWHFERAADDPGSAEQLHRVLYRNPRYENSGDELPEQRHHLRRVAAAH